MPTKAVQKVQQADPDVILFADGGLTREAIIQHYCPGANPQEAAIFFDAAKANGLDPRKREVYFVKYGGKPGTPVTGYQVYLQRAQETGDLDGWKIEMMGTPSQPETCRAVITINRKSYSKPVVWEVPFNEFHKEQSTHKQMPTFMLKKVAIAQGFRLAFPEALNGLPYLPEELGVGSSEDQPERDITPEVQAANVNTPVAPPVVPASKQVGPIAKEPPPLTPPPAVVAVPEPKPEEQPLPFPVANQEPKTVTPIADESPLITQQDRVNILGAFAAFSITQQDIEAQLGKTIDQWTMNDKDILLKGYNDLRKGTVKPDAWKAQ